MRWVKRKFRIADCGFRISNYFEFIFYQTFLKTISEISGSYSGDPPSSL
jgi:hypothetical protein